MRFRSSFAAALFIVAVSSAGAEDRNEAPPPANVNEPLDAAALIDAGLGEEARPAATNAQVSAAALNAAFRELLAANRRISDLLANEDYERALGECVLVLRESMTNPASARALTFGSLRVSIARVVRGDDAAEKTFRQLRDEMKAHIMAGPAGASATPAFIVLNRALEEPKITRVTFDALPPGDPRRLAFRFEVFNDLVSDRKYASALELRPFTEMSAALEAGIAAYARSHDKSPTRYYNHVLDTAAINVEILAGAGDLDHARELIRRVLSVDASKKRSLSKALSRAGHPELPEELKR